MPQAKKQSRFSKINFKSPKTRIILTVTLFAVVGGGIMVFKSFASTMIGTVNADQIRIHTDRQNPASTKIADNYNGKTTANVWKVPVGGTLQTTPPMSIPANVNYQICYSVKGVGSFYGTFQSYGVTNGSSYQQYCGSAKASGNGFSLQPTFQNTNSSGDLYLQAITIQTAANSTPTPAPTK